MYIDMGSQEVAWFFERVYRRLRRLTSLFEICYCITIVTQLLYFKKMAGYDKNIHQITFAHYYAGYRGSLSRHSGSSTECHLLMRNLRWG